LTKMQDSVKTEADTIPMTGSAGTKKKGGGTAALELTQADPEDSGQIVWARVERDHEDDRKRWARHLHDRVAIALSDLKNRINQAFAGTADQNQASVHHEIDRSIDRILDDIRLTIRDLRPPILDDLGLADTLSWYSKALFRLRGMAITVSLNPRDTDLPEPYRTDIFRLIQIFSEGLAAESQADTVQIRIQISSDTIGLDFRDNGLDVASLGQSAWELLPLARIRIKILSLGGYMTLNPAPGKGNTLHVSFPYPDAGESPVSEEAQ
jgi:signal transduction histidine kinase